MLKLIKNIRAKYIPKKLKVGYCNDVCIIIAAIIQKNTTSSICFVYGELNGCLHTWLSIEGIHIDVSTDCTLVNDSRPFVTYVNHREYKIHSIVKFKFSDFYNQNSTTEENFLMACIDSINS